MAQGADYRIKKIEKGPLQRFKNQNLLIKKYGEIGLQIYKAITGKRTTRELRQDLGIEEKIFDSVINYMQSAGMIELETVSAGAKEKPVEEVEAVPIEEIKPEEEISLEELPEKEEEEEEVAPLEEKPVEELEKIAPIEEEVPEKEEAAEEIEPFEFGEIEPVEEEGEELPPEEEVPEEEMEISALEEEEYEGEELSPVEKIISDKYGDIGLRVYALIDGQRTAEEIMSDTGLTESKLVEILDFMDEQGIIKLDYPKGGAAPPPKGPSFAETMAPPAEEEVPREEGFAPILEERKLEEAKAVPSPIEIPIKAPLDIVKSVQTKAKVMLKFGDKGNKMVELIDGKNDMIDISLNMELPLFEVAKMLGFLMQSGMIIMKPLSRTDVRKKYGDDGYSVYKRYGKEGLMLYELIGKEMTIRQMADMITEDRSQIVDMFIFIHQVLGIELPIDKDVLAKQLDL